MFGYARTRKIIRPDERGYGIAYTGRPVIETGPDNNFSFVSQ